MFNQLRRNRNIGTAKQGHGRDNRLRIPSSWRESCLFYEKLNRPVRVTRTIAGQELAFLVEAPLADHRHSCTVDDICRMLSFVPDDDGPLPDIVVLRQPTRKQQILSSVWGRLAYYYETEACSGVAVILESQACERVVKWPKSLSPDDQKEIDRLSNDGHEVRFERKYITIRSTLDTCRGTQLFRTLPHEIGHYRHYRRIDSDTRYQSIPADERERAAHRYAEELTSRLRAERKIPFDRLVDPEALRTDNLPREWFE